MTSGSQNPQPLWHNQTMWLLLILWHSCLLVMTNARLVKTVSACRLMTSTLIMWLEVLLKMRVVVDCKVYIDNYLFNTDTHSIWITLVLMHQPYPLGWKDCAEGYHCRKGESKQEWWTRNWMRQLTGSSTPVILLLLIPCFCTISQLCWHVQYCDCVGVVNLFVILRQKREKIRKCYQLIVTWAISCQLTFF